jgi:hypothetical protein
MRYFILIMAVLLVTAGTAAAQARLSLEPRLGYGTFDMGLMKKMQTNLITSTRVNAQATDSYGPYYQYGGNAVYTFWKHFNAGVFYEHGSTGGRVDYEDYSGSLRLDTRLNFNAYGLLLFAQKEIAQSKLSAVGGLEISRIATRVNAQSHFRIDTHIETDDQAFASKGKGYKAFAGLQYPVLSFPIRLTVGYMHDKSGDFYDPADKDVYVVYSEDNAYRLKPDWSGIRFNLSVSVPILKQRQ